MISDDGTVPEKSAISQWGKFFEEGGKKMGRSFLVIKEGTQRKAMEEAGFVDIQEWEFKVSIFTLWTHMPFGQDEWPTTVYASVS